MSVPQMDEALDPGEPALSGDPVYDPQRAVGDVRSRAVSAAGKPAHRLRNADPSVLRVTGVAGCEKYAPVRNRLRHHRPGGPADSEFSFADHRHHRAGDAQRGSKKSAAPDSLLERAVFHRDYSFFHSDAFFRNTQYLLQ